LPAIVLRRELQCAAPPRALFALLGDTARLYRALGQPALAPTPVASEDGARLELRPLARRGPAFTELPPEWTAPTQLCLRRAMKDGPIEGTQLRFSLTPLLSGTKLAIELSMTPRVPALSPVLHIYAQIVLWHLSRTLAQLDADLLRGANRLLKPPLLNEPALSRAQAAVTARLDTAEREHAARLVSYLRGLDALEVEALAPAAVATALELAPEAALRLLLVASGHGLLALSWDVVCPSCRLPAVRLAQLRELPQTTRCGLCDIAFGVDLAANVEVTFRPAAALRPFPAGTYSGPGPSQLPHVLTQLVLQPESRITLPAPTEPGDYAVVARGGLRGQLRVSTLGPQKAELTIGAQGGAQVGAQISAMGPQGEGPKPTIPPATVEVAVGGTLEISHTLPAARHVTIERTERETDAVFAHEVTAHPLFREHLGDQLLAPGVALTVPPLTLWLGELAGTTEICAQLGDGPAYALVESHRHKLRACIEHEGGALIRADRDSTCAVFRDPLAAARAGAAAQLAVAELRSERPELQSLSLRIGLYSGPCALLSQNGRLDYYGVPVLVAARLLREAHPGDVVLPGDLGERAAAELGASVRLGPRFSLAIKGLPLPISIARLTRGETAPATADMSSVIHVPSPPSPSSPSPPSPPSPPPAPSPSTSGATRPV
jgi:class 3 adenylate cyclase